MSVKSRTVRNLPKKESKDVKQAELNELRRENQKLKRECSRLKREVQKQLIFSSHTEEPVMLEETPHKTKVEECPNCGSPSLIQVKFSVNVMTVCSKCKWRKKPNESV